MGHQVTPRGNNVGVVPAKAGTHTPRIFNWNEKLQRGLLNRECSGYGSPPEPVIGPAKPDPLAGTTKAYYFAAGFTAGSAVCSAPGLRT